MSGPYGPPEGAPARRPAGRPDEQADEQPPWDDTRWPRDPARDWPQNQDQNRQRSQGYPGSAPGAPGYPGQSQGQGYPGPGYGGQGYGGQDYDRGYGQQAGRPAPSFQPNGPSAGARPGYPPRDESFVPGFGPRDDFDGRRDTGRGRRGGADRQPGQPGHPGYDQGYDQNYAAPAAPVDDYRRDNWDLKNNRPRKKATRWLPRILLLVFFGAILIGAGVGGHYVYGKYEAKYHPADYAGAGIKPAVTVQVASGETATGLAPILVKLGVVASARAFTNAVEASSNPTGLEAGFFTMNHHMQAKLAWAALLNPKDRVQQGVTIPEGKRVSQVILILAKETKISVKKFQQVIDHPAKLGLPSYAKGKVEGYLFPATYAIEPKESALTILQAMVTRFKVEAAQVDLPVAAAKIGLTPTQVIVEASMAQAEGGSVSDYPKIARVIINRLHDGMHLQFDSVLLYGLHKYAINVTDKQIATKGPYNDFEHGGLPPGPISNPGDAAIQGILHPATGDWIYFLTNSGGKSTFSATPLSGQ